MDDGKKKGVLIIIIGICIPLFALPFVSDFDIRKGFMHNFYNAGIRITGEKDAAPPAGATGQANNVSRKSLFSPGWMRIEKIPFRMVLIPTFILMYIGIVMIDRARSKARQGGGSQGG